jgi:hypothetical protein
MVHSLHLAGAAYCPQEKLEPWSCGVHCDGVTGVSVRRYIEATDSLKGIFVAYVAYDEGLGSIVVSIRGTDNGQGIQNWLANFDFMKTYPYSQYSEAGVHEGFWDVWTGMKDRVLEGIADITAELGPKLVHFTGHSLGGGIATQAALDLALNHNLTVGAITYGSPRAGDYAYAMAMVQNLAYHFRITHKDDPVAHLPTMDMGFYHPPWEVHFYDREGVDYQQCDGSGEDPNCANACGYYLTCTSIDDHLTYLDLPATCGDESMVVV